MPPKKSKNRESGSRRTFEKCVFYNRGYSKSKEDCEKHHSDKVCEDVDCDEKECLLRHPNPCLFGSRCTFNKRKECLYSHDTVASSNDETIKALENTFNEQFKKMENSVKQLQDDLKKRDVKIKLLEDNFDKLEDSINKSQGHCKKNNKRVEETDNKLKRLMRSRKTWKK